MQIFAYKKRKLLKNEIPHEVFERFKKPHSFLLESGGEEAGWSFIGCNPAVVLEKNGKLISQKNFSYFDDEIKCDQEQLSGDIFGHIKKLNDEYGIEGELDLNLNLPPFIGGACGFFSYDFGLEMALIKSDCKTLVQCPDVYFGWFNKIIAFNKTNNELWFLTLGPTEAQAQAFIEQLEDDFDNRETSTNTSVSAVKKNDNFQKEPKIESNLTLEQYEKCIGKIKNSLLAGETYQVNFAQQFELKSDIDSWLVYKKLFKINPSQQACFFQHPDFTVISSSPERLVSVYDGVVQTCPIKGTVKRGNTVAEDKEKAEILLNSKKNKAELAMIVDLARNDLGQVCQTGSVKVTSDRKIMKLSHVLHTYSVVEGKLHEDKDNLDVFKALFPGGSITGCPKRRTMEIISDLEKVKRAVYCGSAGYFSANGNMDFNIMIRTLLNRDGSFYFGAGGGVVVDSSAKEEYEESFDKAKALFMSLSA